jgi:signal transduction histidine kinase
MDETIHASLPIYEYILRTTADGVIILADGIIQHVNPAAAAMLAMTTETCIGAYPRDVATFRDNPALLRLVTGSGEQRLDVHLPRKRIAQGLADTLDTGERIVLLQDVTEKRSIEDRREMLSKAIAHDLRNPISAIAGFADLIQRFGSLNANQTKYYKRIKETTSKLHELVKSLVDLAWIEAGMPLEHLPIRIHDLIQRAVRDLSDLASKRNIGILVSVQTPLPIVMGDPDRLYMVIHALLHNAIIYSPPESNVAIHAWGDTHELSCSVGDRGFGILDSEIDLIFDRMYRSRDERVREVAGGGLGLTLAKTIVTRHGGDLWVNSIFDEGSTFMFVLPVVDL